MTFCMSRVHAVLEFRQGIVSLSYGACGIVEVVTACWTIDVRDIMTYYMKSLSLQT